jgi:hypothetical protein
MRSEQNIQTVALESDVDVEAVMKDVKNRVYQNRQKALAEGLSPNEFVFEDYPEELNVGHYDPEFYKRLRLANQPYKIRGVHPVIRSSQLTRLPVFGRILAKIQAASHNLVIFYVNSLGAEVIGFQKHVASVLNRLVSWNQAHDREIMRLQQEVEALKKQIELLKAKK